MGYGRLVLGWAGIRRERRGALSCRVGRRCGVRVHAGVAELRWYSLQDGQAWGV